MKSKARRLCCILGAVHKLCRLGRGKGVKNHRLYVVKRQQRGGEGGQKSPFLRRHSLWTVPKDYSICLDIMLSKLELNNTIWTIGQYYETFLNSLVHMCFTIHFRLFFLIGNVIVQGSFRHLFWAMEKSSVTFWNKATSN